MYGLAASASVQFVMSKLKGGQSEQTQQSHQTLSSALHTHTVTPFLSKHRKTVQYPEEADAPLVSSNSHAASLTHNFRKK